MYKGTSAGSSTLCLGTVAGEKLGDMCASAKDCIPHTAPDKYWGENSVGAKGKERANMN